MRYGLVSFDLQGTLSDERFSNEFWQEVLPNLYAKKNKISFTNAKKDLLDLFSKIGRYDQRYYCIDYWLKRLSISRDLQSFIPEMQHKPHFYKDFIPILQNLKNRLPVVVLTTTTHDFINLEMGKYRSFFSGVFPTLEAFNIAGKTPQAFELLAKKYNVETNKIIHVGDDPLMDVENAQAAGCEAFYFNKNLPRKEVVESVCNAIF